MSIVRTSPITMRFVFNRNTGGIARGRYSNAASRFVAKEIAMNIADEHWQTLKYRIASQVTLDVKREMSHIAQEYLRLVVGISGSNEGPKGTLTPAAVSAFGGGRSTSYNLHIAWDERDRDYLKRKRRQVGHTRWFEHERLLARTMGKASTWLGAFGPIDVQVTRKSMSQNDAIKGGITDRWNVGGAGGKTIRVQVGTIRVFAMRSITPRMLPALASGNIDDIAADGVSTGLLSHFPKDIQHHLAPNRKFVPYRHSVEPFLGFFLTRALPNAVLRRLEENLHADTRRA